MHQPSGSAPGATTPAQTDTRSNLLFLGLEPTPLERPSTIRRRSPLARLLGLVGGTALAAFGGCDFDVEAAELSSGLDNGTVSRAEIPTTDSDPLG